MNFKFLTFEELKKELDKHTFKQLHIHHTWKPTHRSFKDNNHIALQQSIKNHHVKNNRWSDIGQHLTLFPDGKWLTGRAFDKTPASISGWNTGALAVEMVGNFDKFGEEPYNELGYDELEGEQKRQILLLMKYFIDKYGEESIKFHRDHPNVSKTCPGTSLNKYSMIKEAKAMSEKKSQPKQEHYPSSWAKEAWEWGIKEGITDGTNPKDIATREQVVAMLYRFKKEVK